MFSVPSDSATTPSLKETFDSDASVTALSTDGNCTVYGDDFGNVNQIKPKPKFLLKSSLAIRDLSICSKLGIVAVADDELIVKILNLNDDGSNVSYPKKLEHDASVKSLCFSPSGDQLATANSKGVVTIWNLKIDPPVAALSLPIIKDEVPEEDLCRFSWHPSQGMIAIAGSLNDILLVNCKNGNTKKLNDPEFKHFHNVKYSPNGLYVVAADVENNIAVWNTGKEKCLARIKHDAWISSLTWHPKKNIIFLGDKKGRIFTWDVVIPEIKEEKKVAQISEVEKIEEDTPESPKKRRLWSESKSLEHAVFDSDNDEPAESGGASKRPRRSRVLDDEASEDDNAEDDLEDDDAEDGFVVDDDGAGYKNPIDDSKSMQKYYDRQKKSAKPSSGRMFLSTDFDSVDPQDAFQPGSTAANSGGRYLAFNMTGVITSKGVPNVGLTVNIEFNDKSSARDISFTDHHNFTMASLHERGALFACESRAGQMSSIYFKPFDTWTGEREWNMNFPPNENAKAVAVSSKCAIVATDHRYIRFFTFGGVQEMVICAPGPVIAMASAKDTLFLAYHSGSAAHGDQNIDYLWMNVVNYKTLAQGKLFLSPVSRLTWLGFSETGLPASYDSSGVLRLLIPHMDFKWIPAIDSRIIRKSPQEHHWPVGVTETQMICGEENTPSFPRPPTVEFDLKIPLIGQEPSFEEKLIRNKIMLKNYKQPLIENSHVDVDEIEDRTIKIEAEIDKGVLMLIQSACKLDKPQRVLDLCSMLESAHSMNMAMKIALYFNLPSAAEKINFLKEAKIRKEQEAESEKELTQPIYYTPQPKQYSRHEQGSPTRNNQFSSPLKPLERSFSTDIRKMTPTKANKVSMVDLEYEASLDIVDDVEDSVSFFKPKSKETKPTNPLESVKKRQKNLFSVEPEENTTPTKLNVFPPNADVKTALTAALTKSGKSSGFGKPISERSPFLNSDKSAKPKDFTQKLLSGGKNTQETTKENTTFKSVTNAKGGSSSAPVSSQEYLKNYFKSKSDGETVTEAKRADDDVREESEVQDTSMNVDSTQDSPRRDSMDLDVDLQHNNVTVSEKKENSEVEEGQEPMTEEEKKQKEENAKGKKPARSNSPVKNVPDVSEKMKQFLFTK
ncbi:hypothetical protein HK098_003546 [Nowakowskiella sp. JEL0407]|nr:hypothetical protein HK098_003546 [Nowakowskiella sp. JEL0407]